jgi:23S rRNA (uridine2552-2'-O)-methyltransferase
MGRTKAEQLWLRRQASDPYVKRARKEGYRSRAAFKLLEMDQRDRLLRPGAIIIDLGAAPGGWSQVAAQRLRGTGRVLAVDLLRMAPIDGVEILQADLREPGAVATLMAALGDGRANLVMSDMAPNMTGISSIDQPRALRLAETALEVALRVLLPGGAVLLKVFQGEGVSALGKEMRRAFERVEVRKPGSSRAASREIYLLGRHFDVC